LQLEDWGSGEDDVDAANPSWRTPTAPRASVTPPLNSPETASDSPPTSHTPAIVTSHLNNARPELKKKLAKLAVVVGKPFRRRVPEETFGDAEDGGTRKLRLSLRWPNGSVVGQGQGWVKFDSSTQELKLL